MSVRPSEVGGRYLLYHTYCSGRSGLSNGIMSIELGVVLAFLTDRLLVLEGNVSPTANVVDYRGALPGGDASRVTDLLEMPVPWAVAEDIDLRALDCVELTDQPLRSSVFYFPPDLDPKAFDVRSFARGRTHFFSYEGRSRDATVLRLSGGPPVGPNSSTGWTSPRLAPLVQLTRPKAKKP